MKKIILALILLIMGLTSSLKVAASKVTLPLVTIQDNYATWAENDTLCYINLANEDNNYHLATTNRTSLAFDFLHIPQGTYSISYTYFIDEAYVTVKSEETVNIKNYLGASFSIKRANLASQVKSEDITLILHYEDGDIEVAPNKLKIEPINYNVEGPKELIFSYQDLTIKTIFNYYENLYFYDAVKTNYQLNEALALNDSYCLKDGVIYPLSDFSVSGFKNQEEGVSLLSFSLGDITLAKLVNVGKEEEELYLTDKDYSLNTEIYGGLFSANRDLTLTISSEEKTESVELGLGAIYVLNYDTILDLSLTGPSVKPQSLSIFNLNLVTMKKTIRGHLNLYVNGLSSLTDTTLREGENDIRFGNKTYTLYYYPKVSLITSNAIHYTLGTKTYLLNSLSLIGSNVLLNDYEISLNGSKINSSLGNTSLITNGSYSLYLTSYTNEAENYEFNLYYHFTYLSFGIICLIGLIVLVIYPLWHNAWRKHCFNKEVREK